MRSPVLTLGVVARPSSARRNLRSPRVHDRHDKCPGCNRSPAARSFDRVRLAVLPAAAVTTCCVCHTTIAPEGERPVGLLRAVLNAPISSEFRTPLHLVLYQGSGSMFRGGRTGCRRVRRDPAVSFATAN